MNGYGQSVMIDMDSLVANVRQAGNDVSGSAGEIINDSNAFRGTNSVGELVDLIKGTVLGMYDNLVVAEAAREAIKVDIRQHTQFELYFHSGGRTPSIRCNCCCGQLDRKAWTPPPLTPQRSESDCYNGSPNFHLL